MKKVKTAFFVLLFLTALFPGCKKEEGIVGKKVVTGTVFFRNGVTGTNDPAVSAIVYITYGATESTGSYDQTTTSNADGIFTVKGLQKGDYYITADYTDIHGFRYTTPGYSITINNKKSELTLDIVLE